VEATNPITWLFFKNKPPEAEKLQDTFSQYNQGTLLENKYVIIHNLHTRYLAKSKNDKIIV